MRARELIKVSVWNPTGDSPFVPGVDQLGDWEDITRGVLSISTRTGSDNFEGFWDQSDTGQFTIVSRGPTADPKLNSLMKTNALIMVHYSQEVYPGYSQTSIPFIGFITNIDVDYRKNEVQTVTINGTDLMGYLNRLIVTQDFIDTSITPKYPDNVAPIHELINNATWKLSPTLANFFNIFYMPRIAKFLSGGTTIGYDIPEAPLVKIEANKTVYELIIAGVSSGLITYENQGSQSYYFYPYLKYDPTLYLYEESSAVRESNKYYIKTNLEDAWQNGSPNQPYDLEFKYIKLNDGINKIINQVGVNNTNPKTDEYLSFNPVINDQSVSDWGPAKLEASTTFSTTTNPFWLSTSTIEAQVEEYQDNILQYQSIPEVGIESITIDMLANLDDFNTYLPDNNTEFYIQHKIDEDTYVAGNYVVSGVRHMINESDWFCEFILRKSEWEEYEEKKPRKPNIALSSFSGSTATTFTASISNYTTAELNALKKIEWMVNLPQGYTPSSPPSQVFNSNKAYFGDGGYDSFNPPIFTGNTVSWNYDDQGPLVGYPEEFYGPGTYSVAVWITNQDGYTTSSWSPYDLNDQFIEVGSATAYADFISSVDSYGVVTFTDASAADTNTWEWQFGDGTTYSGKTPPKKTYSSTGTYNVTLTVNNGYDFDSVVKQVTITSITLPVQYIRLRFQGTVTKPAGQADYTTDLIDSLGGLRVRNLSNVDANGIMPFYLHARTLDKVQLVTETPYVNAAVSGPANPPSSYNPTFIDTPGDYYGQGALNPMSQNYFSGWGPTGGGRVMKYKFHPVITDNPDGSQTKTYDFDLTFEYSMLYGTSNVSNPWYPGTTYAPGGDPSQIAYWTQWGAGGSSSFDQRYKIQNIWYYPGNPLDVYTNTSTTDYTPLLVDTIGNLQTGKTYLPIEISVAAPSVSGEPLVFRKVGTAAYDGSSQPFVTTFLEAMPPKSTLPIQTP